MRRLPARAAEPAKAEHEALPLKAEKLFTIGKFAVTNSMLVTWIVAAGIIVFAQAATRKIKPIPSGMQNFWEWLVEGLYGFLEGVIGRSVGPENILVFRDHFHLHFVFELVRTHSRRRDGRLGTSRSGDKYLSRRSSACFAAQMRI